MKPVRLVPLAFAVVVCGCSFIAPIHDYTFDLTDAGDAGTALDAGADVDAGVDGGPDIDAGPPCTEQMLFNGLVIANVALSDETRGVELNPSIDLNVTEMHVAGIRAPSGGTFGARIYDPEGVVIATDDVAVSASSSPQTVVFAITATLVQFMSYRPAVYVPSGGALDLTTPTFPITQDARVIGAARAPGDARPVEAQPDAPQITLVTCR